MQKYDYTKVTELNSLGYSVMEISREVGIPRTSLQGYFKRNNIKHNTKHFYKYDHNKVLKMNESGMLISHICKELDAPYQSIISIITHAGQTANFCKTTDYNQVQEMINSGMYVDDIAKMLNISSKWLYTALKEKGITINYVHKQMKDSIELYMKGTSIEDIAAIKNIEMREVEKYLIKHNVIEDKDLIRREIIRNKSIYPMDEFRAYFLGVIAGDGNVGNERTRNIRIRLNDKDILESINKNLFEDQLRITKGILPSGKELFGIDIYCNIWKEIYNRWGLYSNKSSTIEIPDLEEKYLSHFIRGLIDTDGSFYLGKKYLNGRLFFSYGTKSKKMIDSVSELLFKNCNIKTNNLRTHILINGDNFYTIKSVNKQDPLKIGEWIYQNSEGNRGERKFLIWNNYKTQKEYYG